MESTLNSRLIQLDISKIKDDISKYEKETMRIKLLIQSKFNRLEKEMETRIKQLSIKDETYTKEELKIEERLNKLEEDNRELRKIIDELRPTKSKYM
jgi:hypothetical protein